MAYPDSILDLLEGTTTGILSTVAPSGLIQSTAVIHLFEEGTLMFSLSSARKKTRNLLADPRATYFVIDPANPYHFVEVRGRVTSEVDSDFTYRTKISERYGMDIAQFDAPEDIRYVFTMHPEVINAQ